MQRRRRLQRRSGGEFQADGLNDEMAVRGQKLIEQQYDRTSISGLLVSLCTLGVAITGLIYSISGYQSQQKADRPRPRPRSVRNFVRRLGMMRAKEHALATTQTSSYSRRDT
jgi:hypothetical protein